MTLYLRAFVGPHGASGFMSRQGSQPAASGGQHPGLKPCPGVEAIHDAADAPIERALADADATRHGGVGHSLSLIHI